MPTRAAKPCIGQRQRPPASSTPSSHVVRDEIDCGDDCETSPLPDAQDGRVAEGRRVGRPQPQPDRSRPLLGPRSCPEAQGGCKDRLSTSMNGVVDEMRAPEAQGAATVACSFTCACEVCEVCAQLECTLAVAAAAVRCCRRRRHCRGVEMPPPSPLPSATTVACHSHHSHLPPQLRCNSFLSGSFQVYDTCVPILSKFMSLNFDSVQ